MTANRTDPPRAFGAPSHLAGEAHVQVLEHCPGTSDEQTRAVHRILLRLTLTAYQQGKAQGSAETVARHKALARDVGMAWAEAMRELVGLPSYAWHAPTTAAVAAHLRARHIDARTEHVRAVCEAAGLPLADAEDPP